MALTWLEISADSLRHNLHEYARIAPEAQIWPVIKSNAYGHGLKEVVEVLDKDEAAKGFMLANLSEAIMVKMWTAKPLMVLSYFEKEAEELNIALEQGISLPVYDLATAQYLDDLAASQNKKFVINIKVDTGTNRLGFRAEEAEEAIKQIQKYKNLQIFSVFTHYAESESADTAFSQRQLKILSDLKIIFPNYYYHSACSAAALNLPASQNDLVRLGISLYGLWASAATQESGKKLGISLEPVLSWKTKIIQLKKVKAQETIGYNRTYELKEDSQLAILPVGYYEGYSRSLSNQGLVIIQNKIYPVRGNVCMNLMMVEIPQEVTLSVGEEVVLLGQSKDCRVTADQLATLAKTINYEIVARLNPQTVRRLV